MQALYHITSRYDAAMIARIRGRLVGLSKDSALLELGSGLTYEVLLPSFSIGRLGGRLDQEIELQTLHYLEGQNQGATMLPRLAGFETVADREFYQLFTTCKGLGNRRALRALALPTGQIASAIVDRDASLLQSLPEIGKRLADTIIATLTGKVDAYVSVTSVPTPEPGTPGTPAPGSAGSTRAAASGGRPGQNAMIREALAALVNLGENRVQALQWIEQAVYGNNPPESVDELIRRVYERKSG